MAWREQVVNTRSAFDDRSASSFPRWLGFRPVSHAPTVSLSLSPLGKYTRAAGAPDSSPSPSAHYKSRPGRPYQSSFALQLLSSTHSFSTLLNFSTLVTFQHKMAPISNMEFAAQQHDMPISRTVQYKKVNIDQPSSSSSRSTPLENRYKNN